MKYKATTSDGHMLHSLLATTAASLGYRAAALPVCSSLLQSCVLVEKTAVSGRADDKLFDEQKMKQASAHSLAALSASQTSCSPLVVSADLLDLFLQVVDQPLYSGENNGIRPAQLLLTKVLPALREQIKLSQQAHSQMVAWPSEVTDHLCDEQWRLAIGKMDIADIVFAPHTNARQEWMYPGCGNLLYVTPVRTDSSSCIAPRLYALLDCIGTGHSKELSAVANRFKKTLATGKSMSLCSCCLVFKECLLCYEQFLGLCAKEKSTISPMARRLL